MCQRPAKEELALLPTAGFPGLENSLTKWLEDKRGLPAGWPPLPLPPAPSSRGAGEGQEAWAWTGFLEGDGSLRGESANPHCQNPEKNGE